MKDRKAGGEGGIRGICSWPREQTSMASHETGLILCSATSKVLYTVSCSDYLCGMMMRCIGKAIRLLLMDSKNERRWMDEWNGIGSCFDIWAVPITNTDNINYKSKTKHLPLEKLPTNGPTSLMRLIIPGVITEKECFKRSRA